MSTSGLRLVLAGDANIHREIPDFDDPRFTELVELIRSGDAAVTNLETPIHDYDVGYASSTGGGTKITAPPWALDDLMEMGFDLYAAANNNMGDYSIEGVLATIEALSERDLAFAGLGRNHAEARSPARLVTPNGHVGMVTVTTTFGSGREAGRQRGDMRGRPGIAPLRIESHYELPDEEFEQLREIGERLGLDEVKKQREVSHMPYSSKDGGSEPTFFTDDEYHLLDFDGGEYFGSAIRFVRGETGAIHQKFTEKDKEELLQQLSYADDQTDVAIASVHTHEGEDGRFNDTSVPPLLESLARECIDAGADVFHCHGSHTLKGIELYDGSPVFYGLGNLMYHVHSIPRFAATVFESKGMDPNADPGELFRRRMQSVHSDEYWYGALPICEFDGAGDLEEITLHPLDLGVGREYHRIGTPLMADEEVGADILESMKERSAAYGTEVEIEDGVGVIRVD